jgi:hypothetical protein
MPASSTGRSGGIGYSEEMLVDDMRHLDSTIYSLVQDHLLNIQLSNLIPDLSRVNDVLEAHLQQSLRGFKAHSVPEFASAT